MSQAKQPKPFLKRGTRQFLSNATVRSLNQKPNIVDFGAEEEEAVAMEKPWKKAAGGAVKKEEEIKIQIKVKERPKENKPAPSSNEQRKAKENKVQNEEKATPASTNSAKKKPALLEDYLGALPKKDMTRSSYSKDKNPPAKVTTMAGMLKRQDEEEEEPSDSSDEPAQKVTYQPVKAPPTVVNSRKLPPAKVVEEEQPAEQVNFQSDSEEEEKPKPANNFKQPLKMQQPIKPAYKPPANTWDEEDEDRPNEEQNRGPSKILQKYYKKEVEALPNKPNNLAQPKKMTVADIPNELKEQLFNEFVTDKGAEIQKKLGELQATITKRKKEQQKFEQQNRRLTKEREQFQRELQEKNREFEEKVKNENSKLTREKRYMKDVQTTGKADWKTKNQVEELRAKLEQAESEKKKIKSELTREIDRLRKKIEEETAEKDSLKGQIRCLELEKIRSKEQTKESKESHNTQVTQNSRQLQVSRNEAIPKLGYWWDAPKTSFTSAFFDDSFTLISLQAHMYKVEALQHYQYYLEKKDEVSQLVSETQDQSGTKLTRTYRNGKMQQEYVSRVLRENFPPPFKFTVVQHLNGDLKLVLPEGIHVYYDRNKQITEFRITPSKMIHHFHRQGQVEMKFTHPRLGTIHEMYSGTTLVRKVNGDEEKWKRSERGVVKM